jgi:hypothetical protein
MKFITQDNGRHDIKVCVSGNPDFYLPENISDTIREKKETQWQSQKGLTKKEREKLRQKGLSNQEIEKKDVEAKKQQMFEVSVKDYIMFAGIEFFREMAAKIDLFKAQEEVFQRQQQEEQRKKSEKERREKEERKKNSFRSNVAAFALGCWIGDSLFGGK